MSGQAIGHPLEVFANNIGTKIDQQAKPYTTQFDVGQQLLAVYRQQCLDGFQFDHHLVLHQQVNPLGLGKMQTSVLDGNRNLLLHL